MHKIHDIFFNLKLIEILKKQKKLLPCLFLDRDGVIIKDCNYIKKEKDVILEKGAFNLIKNAYEENWIIVIITNQSGINRGILNWEDYKLVTSKMISLFRFGNPFAAIYANSLGPDSKTNCWRKPCPDMILQALKDLPIDLEKSILIGDRISDLKAGLNANIKKLFHVETGHGIKERESIILDKDLSKLIYKESFIKQKTNLYLINNLEEFPIDILN